MHFLGSFVVSFFNFFLRVCRARAVEPRFKSRTSNLHRSCRRTRNQIASRAIPQREKERDVIRHLRQSPSELGHEGDTLSVGP